MARDPLYGIRLKLSRAEQQIQSLQSDIDAFCETEPNAVSPKYNPQTREFVLVANVLRPCPGVWGVEVGEIVHNLRSALDHLVWELVIHNTGSPPTSNKSQFPIFETQAGYNNRAGKCIVGVAQAAATLIEAAQPFATGEGCRSPLWRLHELSNFDKHRTLHIAGVVLEGGEIELVELIPGTPKIVEARPPGPFEDGAILIAVRFPGAAYPFSVPIEKVQVRGPVRLSIGFDNACAPVAGAHVIETVGTIGIRVHETIERISREILGLVL